MIPADAAQSPVQASGPSAQVFGFVSLLTAVPLPAAIAALSRFGLRRYLARPVDTGMRPN